jgi:hypothetical protein
LASGSQLTVTVANSASDGQISAEAVRIVPAYQPAEIVSNGYPGSWVSATGWTTINEGIYGDALVSNTANGSKQSEVAWWFPCRPGQYEVDVTWQPGANYSQNTPFDVYNALSWIKTATVNERNAPSGTMAQGVVWQSLGVFTMTSDVLHLSTWNSPTDGAIYVDGVRIAPVSTSAGDDETATGATMVVAAPVTSTASTAVPSPASSSPLESNGWFIEPASAAAAVSALATSGNLPRSSSNESATGSLAPTEWKPIDPKVVDCIDLANTVENEIGCSFGLDHMDASFNALTTNQLGVGVRRTP